MLRLAADENFNNDIVRGLLRRKPELDIIRVQDAGVSGNADPIVLEWYANNNRVLLTHDVRTITKHAYARVSAGKPIPGVFEVSRDIPLVRRSKTSFCLKNTALTVNGKDKFATCHYVKAVETSSYVTLKRGSVLSSVKRFSSAARTTPLPPSS